MFSPVRLQRLFVAGGLSVAFALVPHFASAETHPGSAPVHAQAPPQSIPHADVLSLSSSFRKTLTLQIAPIKQPEVRARALHELLFSAQGYHVIYEGQHTRTAMETLSYGSGNCVSLASLYVAAARHVGLEAHFQESQAEDWEDRTNDGGYYVRAGHINVVVNLPRKQRLTVEFLQTLEDVQTQERVISDAEALSLHYNNLGMQALHRDDLQLARSYLEAALGAFDKNASTWSNMGVVEKRLGRLAAAETAYLTALQQEKDFPSAATNLYILYTQLDKPALAEKYAAMVEEHNRKNPYYLHHLAQEAVTQEDYREAVKLLKKAVDIKNDEDRFHSALARAYHLLGDVRRARQAMGTALKLADNPTDQERYSNKLAALHQLSEDGSSRFN